MGSLMMATLSWRDGGGAIAAPPEARPPLLFSSSSEEGLPANPVYLGESSLFLRRFEEKEDDDEDSLLFSSRSFVRSFFSFTNFSYSFGHIGSYSSTTSQLYSLATVFWGAAGKGSFRIGIVTLRDSFFTWKERHIYLLLILVCSDVLPTRPGRVEGARLAWGSCS